MADLHAVDADADFTGLLPPERRGNLVISTRALAHIVEAASRDIAGTVAHSSGLGWVGGYPRAHATITGDRAWATLEVAATWPCAAATVAREVRDRVRRETGRLSGLSIESLDVTLHVVAPREPSRRVR